MSSDDRRGRPKKDNPNVGTFLVRLTREQKDDLRILAAAEGMGVSTYVRRLVLLAIREARKDGRL